MRVLVYMEIKDGKVSNNSLELLTAAKKLGETTAVAVGDYGAERVEPLAAYGIPVLHMVLEEKSQDAVLDVLYKTVVEHEAEAVLFGASQDGKDLAPRLAARLQTGCVTDAAAIEKDGDRCILTRPAYGGSVLETLTFAEGKTVVAAVRSGSFPKPEAEEGGQLTVTAAKAAPDAIRAKLTESTKEITEMVDLEGAEVIVAGGRGCGSAENFHLVEELAALLGGVTGASRPAIEEGWVSRIHQVGQSGKTVAPKLYIACGISGAMQHISGIMDSDYIVAINKDEDAPIFEVADISIVGRCEEILPIMIDQIRSMRS